MTDIDEIRRTRGGWALICGRCGPVGIYRTLSYAELVGRIHQHRHTVGRIRPRHII